ncbi:MAG: hypothetical protein LIO70_06805 [Clostridiales bacterium]|nr:hypothetical protein [Clostridiales bacterium]
MSEMNTKALLCRDSKGRDFFDPEKEFFLIDSEHLDVVKSHFYGFSVQSSGIYEQDNLTPAAADALDGCGAYVYVERMADGQIRIRQDFNGCWGIYLYRNGDYFALSSSFLRLLEHISRRFPISIDRDYMNQYLLAGLCSHAYSESAVKEIKRVDKDAVVIIDPKAATLRFESTNHVDESIAMDTPEGVAVLDHWFDKWTTLFRNLKARTSNIQTSLSGGFDSRITFLLMLCSGINLSEIQVYSIHDGLHTHAEDYEIASEIADYYGFKLNNKELDKQALHFSLRDSINISFHTKIPVHKQLNFKTAKFAEKRYFVPGSGGESLRAHWNQSPQSFDDEHASRGHRYSWGLENEVGASVRSIHQSAYRGADEKFGAQEENSIRYPMYLYRMTRCRHHFGTGLLERLFSNGYELTPLLDPDLWSLKLETADCQDWNLLMALIYVRYCPSLLNFRFEGGRSISSETIAYAQRLNERFPRPAAKADEQVDASFSVITKDEKVLEVLRSGQDNPVPPASAPERYLKAVYNSCSFQKLFETCFDREIYDFAKRYAVEKDFYPMQECYAVIGVTKVIGDVLASHRLCQPSITENLDSFLEENPYEPDDLAALVNRYRDDLTGRVDVKVTGEGAGMELAEISDFRATVRQPEWLQKDGVGYVIEAYHGTLDLKLHIFAGEELSIKLRGRDVRNEKGERVPYWITYQNVTCNGESELQETRNICHDKPFSLSRPVQAGEIVTLHLEWTPCRYTTERADALEKKLNARGKKLSSTKAALSSTEAELSALKKELSAQKKELAAMKKKNAALKGKIASMQSSTAWRLGRALTWPMRKLKGLLTKQRC